MPSPETRVAFVSGDRLPGWVDRFAASHGVLVEEELDAGLQLRAADGAVAVLRAPWPVDGRPGSGHDALSRLASLAGQNGAGTSPPQPSATGRGACRSWTPARRRR